MDMKAMLWGIVLAAISIAAIFISVSPRLPWENYGTGWGSGNTTVTACGSLNDANQVFTLANSVSINGATCFTFNASNQTLNCNGYSITGNNTTTTYGLYGFQKTNITILNCNVSNFQHAVYFTAGGTNTNLYNLVNNSNLSTTHSTGNGVLFGFGANSVTLSNSRVTSTVNPALFINQASLENITSSTITSSSSNAVSFSGGTNNIFKNNSLSAPTQNVLKIGSGSTGNTFYWNNFASSTSLYVNDTSGSNKYNSTLSGTNEGNIYANVNSSNLTGTVRSVGLLDYKVATGGTSYPYNNSTSGGKFVCSYANCSDYAPLFFSPNLAPTASITYPANGSSFTSQTWMNFTFLGTDAENATLIGKLYINGTLNATNSSLANNSAWSLNQTLGYGSFSSVFEVCDGMNCTNSTSVNFSLVDPNLYCGVLGTPNTVYNMTVNLTTNGPPCFNITAENITLDCKGYSISGNATEFFDLPDGLGGGWTIYPGLVYANRSGVTVRNCNISASTGVALFVGALNNSVVGANVLNTNISSADDVPFRMSHYISPTFTNVLVENVSATAPSFGSTIHISSNVTVRGSNFTAGEGLTMASLNGSLLENNIFNATSTASQGFTGGGGSISDTLSSTIRNNTFYSASSWAAYILIVGGVVANNTFTSVDSFTGETGVLGIDTDAVNTVFYNNTITSTGNSPTLLFIQTTASNNTFYWNNFTGGVVYINDTNGSNYFNTTEGNIYAGVINGSVDVKGMNLSTRFTSLFVGSSGAGYPYNNSTSNGMLVGNVVDYAPLTPFNASSFNSSFGTGINKLRFTPLHAYQTWVEPVNQSSTVPLFNVSASPAGVYGVSISTSPVITGFTLKCAPYYNKSGVITLTAVSQNIANFTSPATQSIWCWADFNNPAPGLKYNISVVSG